MRKHSILIDIAKQLGVKLPESNLPDLREVIMSRRKNLEGASPEFEAAALKDVAAATNDAPKKKRVSFYAVVGCDAGVEGGTIVNVFRSLRKAMAYVDGNAVLLRRVYASTRIMRARWMDE